MANWTFSQIRDLAASTGFSDPDTAAAIAMAESSGNPDAVGDLSITPPYGSVGLWQINVKAHPQYDPQSLHDPNYNAQAALAVSSGGTNFRPWTTYNTGAYLKYMPPPGQQQPSGQQPTLFPWGAVLLATLIIGGAWGLATYQQDPRAFRRMLRGG